MIMVVMSFMRMCYERVCLVGGQVLWANISCWKSCIMRDMFYERLCLTGEHVLPLNI